MHIASLPRAWEIFVVPTLLLYVFTLNSNVALAVTLAVCGWVTRPPNPILHTHPFHPEGLT